MDKKKIFIYANGTPSSRRTERKLLAKLDKSGHTIANSFSEEVDLMVVIGGDGTFLQAIHNYDFPQVPIIGINTGHLGFFQEIMPSQLDEFIFNFEQGKYSIQKLTTVKMRLVENDKEHIHIGLNEVAIKGNSTHSIHLNISIGGSFIERFSGDGLLIATPAGSTAYNYSLGGSIVDPRLNILQVTPIAPMNTTAYRAFTSSILLPSGLSLGVVPDMKDKDSALRIIYDGNYKVYEHVSEIEVTFSDKEIHLLRFENYDFWNKVKTKFL
ncbi:MAG: NAD(+)/NADH kinase [Peptostreptococcaceae bacterium]|nr:NAD(+)/NADH kinase [Peptostreptococcaceae bacterium]MDY5739755.1 NAD(+)/NADH kinase [Anaerovoracaceae bacterium]